MTIQLDFDGTVVVGPYPSIKYLVPGAIEGIKLLKESGHKIILNTFRADIGDQALREALGVLKENGITIDDFNQNKLKPGVFNLSQIQSLIRMSGIIGINNVTIFIDDESSLIPLTTFYQRNIVDWGKVMKMLKKEGIV